MDWRDAIPDRAALSLGGPREFSNGSRPGGGYTAGDADLAQLVEHRSCKAKVVGSNPTVGSEPEQGRSPGWPVLRGAWHPRLNHQSPPSSMAGFRDGEACRSATRAAHGAGRWSPGDGVRPVESVTGRAAACPGGFRLGVRATRAVCGERGVNFPRDRVLHLRCCSMFRSGEVFAARRIAASCTGCCLPRLSTLIWSRRIG